MLVGCGVFVDWVFDLNVMVDGDFCKINLCFMGENYVCNNVCVDCFCVYVLDYGWNILVLVVVWMLV